MAERPEWYQEDLEQLYPSITEYIEQHVPDLLEIWLKWLDASVGGSPYIERTEEMTDRRTGEKRTVPVPYAQPLQFTAAYKDFKENYEKKKEELQEKIRRTTDPTVRKGLQKILDSYEIVIDNGLLPFMKNKAKYIYGEYKATLLANKIVAEKTLEEQRKRIVKPIEDKISSADRLAREAYPELSQG